MKLYEFSHEGEEGYDRVLFLIEDEAMTPNEWEAQTRKAISHATQKLLRQTPEHEGIYNTEIHLLACSILQRHYQRVEPTLCVTRGYMEEETEDALRDWMTEELNGRLRSHNDRYRKIAKGTKR